VALFAIQQQPGLASNPVTADQRLRRMGADRFRISYPRPAASRQTPPAARNNPAAAFVPC